MTRVLVITGGELGARMAGPAIRARSMARVLGDAGHEVVLATTSTLEAEAEPGPYRMLSLRPGDAAAFAELERETDVIVFQGHAMEQFPALAETDRVVVADCYDPMHLEMLEQGREQPRATWEMLVRSRTALLNQQLSRADLILCASPRQRLFYLGQLAALGRISPVTYEDDPHLERLIALAPFGLESVPPRHERDVLRGVVPNLAADDRIVVWGGGLYSWFDPQTLIRAVASLAERRPQTRLVFLGTKHPGVAPMGIVKESIDLATELGVLGREVIFNEGWIPYDERQNHLTEADAGVSTHHTHIETEFSFRTRILDYLWAGLPMVVTEGDSFADLVAEESLGVVVPANDVQALADALEKVLYDAEFAAAARERVAEVRERFVWERAMAPLLAIAAQPRRAADVEVAGSRAALAAASGLRAEPEGRPGLAHDLRMAWHHLRHGGIGELARRVRGRLRRR
ncbi:glycosyltransferase family 4 protein [Salinibacterium sp. ZJ70]|uniref:glycosyltransferase family 4 protein n=1 Tax=Salinibacterium sp. ZJ70 TaxID=2708084 RepID=UPI00142448D9|nr:glycosyltransferase family 4 protein [Salinibacterium sp. ZJ70]